MCQFPLFETIAIVNGEIQNIEFHQQRYEYAIKHYFNSNPSIKLINVMTVPLEFKQGVVRCRIDYNDKEFRIMFFPYVAKRVINLQCVYVENLNYRFKFSDRSIFENLKSNKSEVIIVNNGYVSDCSIGNLIFLKKNKWYSSTHYLLKGTQLSLLLARQKITLVEIPINTLFEYEKIMVINALNPFQLERAVTISTETIFI